MTDAHAENAPDAGDVRGARASRPEGAPAHDDELSARLQARTEELFGTGAISIIPTDEPEPEVRWSPYVPVRKGIGGSALAFAIAALGGSFVVFWMFPLGILALVLGILAVRRPEESTRCGVWAIGLSVLSLIYSGIWGWWAGAQFGLWG